MRTILLSLAALLVLGAGSAAAEKYDAQYMRDRMMIEDVLKQYAMGMDTADPDLYAGAFTEDATLIVGGMTEHGRAEIAAMVAGWRKTFHMPPKDQGVSYMPLRHTLTNINIEIDGDTATAHSYWQTIRKNPDGAPPTIGAMGRYEDHLVKKDGHWLIARREIISDMQPELQQRRR